MSSALDRRPLIVVLAGSNGAGKTTFYDAHIRPCGLRFLNADLLAAELDSDPDTAARMAAALRQTLVDQLESLSLKLFSPIRSATSCRS